jgi:hypothetical protein
MLRRVTLETTDVSEEPSASIIRVTRIGELATKLAVQPVQAAKKYLFTLLMEALCFSETSVLARATSRNILEDGILIAIVLVASCLKCK